MCSLIIINATIPGNVCAKRVENEKENDDTQRAHTHSHSNQGMSKRTRERTLPSVSSFFIKFHHGCPILIVFICWEMFVNVISFNFGGTFLLRRTQTTTELGRTVARPNLRRQANTQHLLCTRSHSLCVLHFRISYLKFHIQRSGHRE